MSDKDDWLEKLRQSPFGQQIQEQIAAANDAPPEKAGEGWEGEVYGFCPVQGYGKVDNLYWYFRARHDEWSFEVWREPFGEYNKLPESDPIWTAEYFYEMGDGDASWMPISRAWILIEQCIQVGRRDNWGKSS